MTGSVTVRVGRAAVVLTNMTRVLERGCFESFRFELSQVIDTT